MSTVSRLALLCASSLKITDPSEDPHIIEISDRLKHLDFHKDQIEIQKIKDELIAYYKRKKVDSILKNIKRNFYGEIRVFELETIVEIFKMLIEKNPERCLSIIQNIYTYNIYKDDILIEIGKAIAQKNIFLLIVYFVNAFSKKYDFMATSQVTTKVNELFDFIKKCLPSDVIINDFVPLSISYDFFSEINDVIIYLITTLMKPKLSAVNEILLLIQNKKSPEEKLFLINSLILIFDEIAKNKNKSSFIDNAEKVLGIITPIILQIFEHKDHKRVTDNINFAFKIYNKDCKNFEDFIYKDNEKKFYIASMYLVDYPNRAAILTKLKKYGFLKKDDSKMRSFVDFLRILETNNKMTNEEKGNLIYYLLDSKTKEKKRDMSDKLDKINGFIYTGNERKLFEKPLDELNLDSLLKDLFKESFNIQNFPDFSKKMEDTIFKFRNRWNVLVYASKMKTLPETEAILALLREYVESILKNNFKEFRYKEGSKHLQTVFKDKELKRVWMEDEKEEMFQDKIEKPKNLKLKDYVFTKLIIDKHIHDIREKLPLISNFLTEETIGGAGGALTEHEELERKIIRLIESNSLQNIDTLIGKLSKIEDFKIFAQDLQELNIQTTQKDVNDTVCTIVDEPEDYISIAKETEGCQSVDGDPKLNKGLIGYIVDGKNRIIAVKDRKTGKLVARSLLRLLWDKKEYQPALLLERMYPSAMKDQNRDAIIKMSIKKANKMGLKLYSNQVDKGDKVDTILVSFDSIAPFEYCDSCGLGVTDGKYEIKGLHEIKS